MIERGFIGSVVCSTRVRAVVFVTQGLLGALGTVAASPGCTSVRSDLGTARELYRAARSEESAAWLNALTDELPSMRLRDRTTYHYLRGMTLYRLAQNQDALHELAEGRTILRLQNGGTNGVEATVICRLTLPAGRSG